MQRMKQALLTKGLAKRFQGAFVVDGGLTDKNWCVRLQLAICAFWDQLRRTTLQDYQAVEDVKVKTLGASRKEGRIRPVAVGSRLRFRG